MNHAPMRSRDLLSIILLTLIVAVVSQRLVATGWAADLEMVALLALLGVLLGLPLGLSRFSRGVVLLFILLYSLVVVPFTLAAVLYPGQPWLERMTLLGGRFLGSMSILAGGNPLEDSFLLLGFFSASFWFIGVGSSYALTRSANFLGAVLPCGVVILLLQLFDFLGSRGVLLTALFIFLVLLLLGRMNYARRREAWRGWRVFPTGEARTDINLSILAGASLLVLTAWLLPVSSRHIPIFRVWWEDMTRIWSRSESLSNLFAGLQVERGGHVNYFYGQYLALGEDAPQSDAILFHIQNTGETGQERYYWRIRSYDTYEDGLWGESPTSSRDFTPLSRTLQLPLDAGVSSEFRIIVINSNLGFLVTPPRPVWVNRPSLLTYLPVAEDVLDPILFRANEPVVPGEEYMVRSLALDPSILQMRAAGEEYPAWVTDRYLQLPPDLPPGIIDLADQLTAEADTAYDKAAAITAYLRREITYTTHMDSPPAGRNVLAWFLFEYKQGFCNYYATAEVMLLRAAGVPARLAAGFSEGEFEAAGWYTVRQLDAHAWPEVYFPGLGWVEFEPTTSEPELVRFQGEIVGPELSEGEPFVPPAAGTGDPVEENLPAGRAASVLLHWQTALPFLLTLLAIVLLVGNSLARGTVSGKLAENYQKLLKVLKTPLPIVLRDWLKKNSLPIPTWLERQALQAGLDPLAREFASVYTALKAFSPQVSTGLTPAEAASALLVYLPEAGEEIRILLEEYQPAYYGTSSANPGKLRLAASSLRQKARQAHSTGWLHKQVNRGKFMDVER